MTIGSLTITAAIAAGLATLVWWVAGRAALPDWFRLFLFALCLALILLAGPLVRLP